MKYLIVTDVDGTLVADGTPNLNPEYYETIEKLIEQGHIVCIASGRQYESIRNLFAPIQDKLYYIAEGGGVVRTLSQVLHIDSLPDCWPGLLEDVLACGEYKIMLATPDESVINAPIGSELDRLMNEGYHYKLENVEDIHTAPWDRAVKISLYHSFDAEGVCARAGLKEKWGDRFQIMCAGVHWVDCVSMTSNKGNAVRFLQEHVGLDKEHTIVFGDNMNDVAMFRQAGTSFAVGSARDEVKACATHVADLLENDGVLKELKKLLES